MTVTTTWIGNGRQFTADIGTDTVTVVKYAGSGGAPSAAAADGSIEGSTALTVKVNKQGVAMFVAVPTALDFAAAGTEEGELIYVWGNFLAAALLLTQANAGFGICLSSGTPTASNYSLFTFFGSDNYAGGWKRMIIDPTKTRSAGAGTLTTSNITHIGVFADVGGITARFDNLLLDACDVGTGLKVTGTSTLGLVEELLVNEATNRYGVISALNDSETAAELAGGLILGDSTGTLSADITDEDSKIFVAEPLYYQASVKAAVPLGYSELLVTGNATGSTDVAIGQAVGTTDGRNGITLAGNDTYDVIFCNDDVDLATTGDFYGTTLENITGRIDISNGHDFDGCTMVSCGLAFVAQSTTVNNLTSVGSNRVTVNNSLGRLVDSSIINSTNAQALRVRRLDNIVRCDFTSDGTGHAVHVNLEVTANASDTWDSTDSGYAATDGSTGNETILCNVASGFTYTINVSAGASTPTIMNTGAGTVSVVTGLSALDFTLSPSITNYEWRIYTVTAIGSLDGATEVDGEELATADNQSYSYTHVPGVIYAIQILPKANDYEEKITYLQSLSTDQDILINLTPDINN